MHPAMALWIWSLTMARIWQNGLVDQGHHDDQKIAIPVDAPPADRPIQAFRYFKSDITASPLPDFLLDRLADLHWLENEPSLAI